jgi:hypothetical protein
MSNPPIRLTRDQLAAFAPNQRVLRALEQLLLNQSDDSSDIVGDFLTAYIEASNASAAANNALALIESRFAELAGMMPPRVEVVQEIDPLPPQIENAKPKLDYFDLDLTPAGIPQEGRTMWDEDYGVPKTGLAGGVVSLQHGLELLKRVRNASGGALTDGQIIYLNDASGAFPKAYLASASSTTPEKWCVCGMVTEPIGSNQPGFVTVIGAVSDVDTSAFVEGTKLYLSATVPGAFTDTMPEAPDAGIPIGIVLRQHATEGQILFFPQQARRFVDLADVNGMPLTTDGQIAVWDQTNSYFDFTANINDKAPAYNGLLDGSLFSVTYTPATRVYEVVVSSDTYAWANGTRVFIAADTYTMDAHSDTTGVYYLLMGEDGTIHVDSTFEFLDHAIISYAYYNATTNKGVAFDERHPADKSGWPASIHSYHHFNEGAKLRSGGTVSGFTLTSNANADMQVYVAETIFDDESLQITCAALTGADGVYTQWYRSGADVNGEWDWTTGANLPIVISTNNPTYNLLSGGNWSNVAITNNSRWVNVWLIATNSLEAVHRFVFIQGQALHTTLAAAEGESFLTAISWGKLPFAEIVPLARITFRRATGTGNNFYIDEVTSIRGTQASVTSTVSPTVHNTLSGRSDPGCHPATAITYADTTVAAELDALGTMSLQNAAALTENTSAVLTITDVTVAGTAPTIQVKQSSAAQSGFLSSTDWSTFNGKQAALGYTAENQANKETALTDSDTKYPTSSAVLDGIALQVNPKQLSQSVAMTAASSGSNGIQVADNANINFGTGNFAVFRRVSLPNWKAAAILAQKHDATDGFIFATVVTSGFLRLTLNDTVYTSTVAPSVSGGGSAEVGAVVSVGATTSVSFFCNGLLLGDIVTAANETTVSNTAAFYASGTSAVRVASENSACNLLNFAPTAAQVLDMYRNGVPEAWKWGSQAVIYASDFSAGANSFVGTRATVAGDIDGIGGEDDWLRLTVDTTDSTHFAKLDGAFPTIGKEYEISIKYFVPSSQTAVGSVRVYDGAATASTVSLLPIVTDVAATHTFTITPRDTGIRIYAGNLDGSVNATLDPGGDDVFYVKDISIKQVGAVLSLEPEGIQPSPGQWLDASTNKLHAMQPSVGCSLTRPQRTFEVRWTNTWTGTHEAQYIGGVNQNVLPPNAYIESIVGTVSGATVEDIIIGDGSDNDRWVTITTGLAAGTTSFTLANRISYGTNRKLVVDPDANATMSIVWTIKGYILEA